MPSKKEKAFGKVYVSSLLIKGKTLEYNSPKGSKDILIHTASKDRYGLSPYTLKDKFGNYLENIWQGSKVYPKVKKVRQPFNRFKPNENVFEHPAEVHIDPKTKKPNDLQRSWRKKVLTHNTPLRYPVGFNERKGVLYSLPYDFDKGEYKEDETLTYVQARKETYMKMYEKSLENHKGFNDILKMIKDGKDVNIIEVDGPKASLSEHYKENYNIDTSSGTVEVSEEILDKFINDEKAPFGHGFTIASILLKSIKGP